MLTMRVPENILAPMSSMWLRAPVTIPMLSSPSSRDLLMLSIGHIVTCPRSPVPHVIVGNRDAIRRQATLRCCHDYYGSCSGAPGTMAPLLRTNAAIPAKFVRHGLKTTWSSLVFYQGLQLRLILPRVLSINLTILLMKHQNLVWELWQGDIAT